MHLTGGCQCGAIRYRADLDPDSAHLCHCRMCQKAAGNYFMPLASTPRSAFEMTRGALTWFASSAVVQRGFCSVCGTPLTFESHGADTLAVTLGSLDTPSVIIPIVQSGSESRLPWFHELPGLREETTADGEASFPGRLATIAASNRQHPDHDTDVGWVSTPR